MTHEIHHIDSDRSAAIWAIGCVAASYVDRSAATPLLRTTFVRGILAAAIVGQAVTFLFATALTLAYRMNSLRLAGFLGGFTPGDDYRRFVPLMDAAPWWLHGLWVAASLMFMRSAWQLVRNRSAAFPVFAVALVLGTLGNVISYGMPEYRQAFSFPASNLTRDYVIPAGTAIAFVAVAMALWVHGRWLVAQPHLPAVAQHRN